MAIQKKCNKIGCSTLIPRGQQPAYCKEHLAAMHKRYDTTQRDPKRTAFYKSQSWKRLRQSVLIEAFGLCGMCSQEGYVKPGDTVHHIIPIETAEGWERRLDRSNLMLVCREHHAKIHKNDKSFFLS